MTLGVVIGKFYPFHKGHDQFIREAKKQVDHLVVLLRYHPSQQIPVAVRAQWIRTLHPNVEVMRALDDIPNTPEAWSQSTYELLGLRPSIVFSSDNSAEALAKLLKAQHVVIDAEGRKFPIRSSDLREKLEQHWDMLTPPAKGYFAKRVAILGAESSGTSTLAEALAKQYQTVWTPEYAQTYWNGRRYSLHADEWDAYEFVNIAQGQVKWEENLAMRANRLLICDNTPLITATWHRYTLGQTAPEVEQIAEERHYDLSILCEPDFDFVGTTARLDAAARQQMHAWLVESLDAQGTPYVTVKGSTAERLTLAQAEIDKILVFSPLELYALP